MKKMFPFVLVGVLAGLLVRAILKTPTQSPQAQGLARVRELANKQ